MTDIKKVGRFCRKYCCKQALNTIKLVKKQTSRKKNIFRKAGTNKLDDINSKPIILWKYADRESEKTGYVMAT